MVDFFIISTRTGKKGSVEIYPKFIIKKSSDLMIRGGDFYAIWLEDKKLWSTDEQDLIDLVDAELDKFVLENKNRFDSGYKILYMKYSETRMIDSFHKYCQRDMRDNYHNLDEELIFSNTELKKENYASKVLPYSLEYCDISNYNELMNTLYSEEERHKIEWCIGSVISGYSKYIQKFLVLYGSAGTGKSTVLNIIQKLFQGYYSVFDAKALGSASSQFALEAFKNNPLVAIQHDGDLSKIEDNTRLNSIVSHELMTVNEKFKATYSNSFKCFLFMGTNKPVKITDAKSGLLRRLIDATPTGNKINPKRYIEIMESINFELGGIACHCRDIFLEDPNYYDQYVPSLMLGASNDFYNFILDSYPIFAKDNKTTLKASWEMYKNYCEDAKVAYPYSMRAFKEELKNYFDDFKERVSSDDENRVRNCYIGFKKNKFEQVVELDNKNKSNYWIDLKEQESILDIMCGNCFAQYANSEGTPNFKWENVKTKLSDLDTKKLHYVQLPKNHIFIDFDLKDENGNKSLEKNIEAANKWPKTYVELSKGGSGLHLHYIYEGDIEKLNKIYSENIEIKVFSGNSSVRRKLTKCNDIPISKISSGLPLREESKKMINFDSVKSEKSLRKQIERNIRKEIHPYTKPSVDFIYKILEDAYNSGLKYDVSDMRNDLIIFASRSTHNSDYCLKMVNEMKFKSDEPSKDNGFVGKDDDSDIVFFDSEVFPNLYLINWKVRGKNNKVVRMINPTPEEIEPLLSMKLVGFNNRKYDNHILYARYIGYNNEELFRLSSNIINIKDKEYFFSEAYNISYTDILDFCSEKMSLKKWEIKLGIHHKELPYSWDELIPKEKWEEVAEYCDNDVLATEAVFEARIADFTARKILADLAGMSVNDTTNSLTTKIIFGNDRNPQKQFNYRNMGDINQKLYTSTVSNSCNLYNGFGDNYTLFDEKGRPVFPGYKFEFGKSTYRGEVVGEGGEVYANPGMYSDVALLDVSSMHPSSAINEELFGPVYTKRFEELKQIRIYIKHREFDKARNMLDGKLKKWLVDESMADDLAQALKIAINAVYGLTAASFKNAFRDERNIDNIVAKRGALFMINLRHEVENKGYIVAHIKTDSIKIPNATPEIIKFVMDYGDQYGYTFEHEATYDRICLVNDAVYIAKYATVERCIELYGKDYVFSSEEVIKKNKKNEGKWTATGTQFQVPYVFKTLFSKEPIVFEDMCETRSVTSSAMYLDFNENLEDVSEKEKQLEKILKKYKDNGVIIDINNTNNEEILSLINDIKKGHKYLFVGRVGLFCPIKKGFGGGVLYRKDKDKYKSISGTKGYRFMESEIVKEFNKENIIDRGYYDDLVNEAINTISKYGDYQMFVA